MTARPVHVRLLLVAVPAFALLVGGIIYVANRGPSIPTACTLIGGDDSLGVRLPLELRGSVATIRVELHQGSRSRSVDFVPAEGDNNFPESPPNVRGSWHGIYRFEIGADAGDDLAASWDGDRDARVIVIGHGRDGRDVFRHEDSFRFGHYYPNGKACDGDGYLNYVTTVRAADFA